MLTLIDPPANEPVTLADTKTQLRVLHDAEDALIESYIRTARQKLDGRDGLLGKCLITQTWELVLDSFPQREISLELSPVQSVTSVIYADADGVDQTIDAANYYVDRSSAPGWIVPNRSYSWPTPLEAVNAVRIRFVAGFGDDPEDVPEPLRTAIAMHAAHLFEHRESVVMGTGFITPTPHGYDDLIRDYRAWSF